MICCCREWIFPGMSSSASVLQPAPAAALMYFRCLVFNPITMISFILVYCSSSFTHFSRILILLSFSCIIFLSSQTSFGKASTSICFLVTPLSSPEIKFRDSLISRSTCCFYWQDDGQRKRYLTVYQNLKQFETAIKLMVANYHPCDVSLCVNSSCFISNQLVICFSLLSQQLLNIHSHSFLLCCGFCFSACLLHLF